MDIQTKDRLLKQAHEEYQKNVDAINRVFDIANSGKAKIPVEGIKIKSSKSNKSIPSNPPFPR